MRYAAPRLIALGAGTMFVAWWQVRDPFQNAVISGWGAFGILVGLGMLVLSHVLDARYPLDTPARPARSERLAEIHYLDAHRQTHRSAS